MIKELFASSGSLLVLVVGGILLRRYIKKKRLSRRAIILQALVGVLAGFVAIAFVIILIINFAF